MADNPQTAVPAVAPKVLIVDDDSSVRSSLDRLFRSVGLRVETFPDLGAFRSQQLPCGPVCLVLDVHLPDGNGIELQQELASTAPFLPVVLITGREPGRPFPPVHTADVVDFLLKPLDSQRLLNAVDRALNLG